MDAAVGEQGREAIFLLTKEEGAAEGSLEDVCTSPSKVREGCRLKQREEPTIKRLTLNFCVPGTIFQLIKIESNVIFQSCYNKHLILNPEENTGQF